MAHPAISLRSRRNRRSLRRLYAAGRSGSSVLLADRAEAVVDAGLGEFFIDPMRVLKDRVRITALGRKVVETLIFPKEP